MIVTNLIINSCFQAMSVSGKVLGCLNLPVQISSYHGLSWSQDNKLAIVTKKGVYVFEIVPSVSSNINNLNFVKTFVTNDSEMCDWQLETVLSEEELMKMNRDHKNMIMMDRVLAPHMASGETTFKQPSKVEINQL